MGVRATDRAPIYRPVRTFIWAMALLASVFGLTLAAAQEAWQAGDHGWAGLFAASALITLALYSWIVRGWLIWIGPTSDYESLVGEVVCSDEDEHLGGREHP